MRRRVPGLTFTAVIALAVLIVGHNMSFLMAYGSGYAAALARTGHDGRWDDTVLGVLATAGLLATAATMRLAHLCLIVVRRRPGAGAGRLSIRAYFRVLVPLWARSFAVAAPLFVVQENFERWNAGLGLPGLAVLGSPGVIGPIPVFAFVSLLVAAVAALFKWGISTLEAQIAAGRIRAAVPQTTPASRLRPLPDRAAISILGRNLAGRAPPSPLPV